VPWLHVVKHLAQVSFVDLLRTFRARREMLALIARFAADALADNSPRGAVDVRYGGLTFHLSIARWGSKCVAASLLASRGRNSTRSIEHF
jgi:hypothetical protein